VLRVAWRRRGAEGGVETGGVEGGVEEGGGLPEAYWGKGVTQRPSACSVVWVPKDSGGNALILGPLT